MTRHDTRLLIHQALKLIGSNGFDGVSTVASSVSGAFLALAILPANLPQARLHQTINELKRQSLIETSSQNGVVQIRLTVKGIHRLQQAEIEALRIIEPDAWDGKWRLVMFDIPVRHNQSRYILSSNLKRLGFQMIQKSFWAHPYPCFDIIEQLIQYANLQGFVSLAEISRLDSSTERRLKQHFKQLP